MLIELGSFRLSTGQHSAVAAPSVEKRDVPDGGTVNTAVDLARTAAQLAAGGQAAQGMRPDPGPLPPATEPTGNPVRYQFPIAGNQTWTPRAGRAISFSTLRTFADACDIVRACIETRKDQLCSLEWEIVGRDNAKPDKTKLAKALAFFESPDASGDGFETWFRCALEEVLVCDNLSLYRRPNKAGKFYSLDIVNGDLFKVLLDADGRVPMPPNKAYRQIVYGAPMRGADYSKDELYYLPKTVRTWTPYGLSPIESILITILTILNREAFDAAYYTDGNMPPGFLTMGRDGDTAAQLRDLQDYIDTVTTGNGAARQKIKLVRNGTQYLPVKPADFNAPYMDLLVKIVCAGMSVPPQELGWTADINKATGKQQENVVYRRGIKPMAAFFKNIFDRVLAHDLDCPELQFKFTGGEAEDKLNQAQVDEIEVRIGKTGVDELRARDGQEPIGLPPYVMTGAGPVLVTDIVGGVTPLAGTAAAAIAPRSGAVLDPPGTGPVDDDQGAPPDLGESGATAVAAKLTAARGELRTWRASAIKAIKSGPLDGRVFSTKHVPAPLAAVIDATLLKARTVGDVVQTFDRADAVILKATAAGARRKRIAKIETSMSAYFKQLHTAVAEHVAAQVS